MRRDLAISKSKAPKAPDPYVTAAAQAQMNEQTARTQARINRVNESDARGTVQYRDLGKEWLNKQYAEIDARAAQSVPGTYNDVQAKELVADKNPYQDQWVKETELSENQQRLFDLGEQNDIGLARLQGDLVGKLGPKLGQDVDTSAMQDWQGVSADGLPAMRGLDHSGIHGPEWLTRDGMQAVRGSIGPSDFSADRQRVEDAMLARLAPQQARDRAAFDAKMAAQGVSQGSQAYGAGADELNRAVNDARLGAVLAGGQEQSRLFGLALQQGQFENASQAQEFAQRAGLAEQHNGIRQNAIAEQVQAAGFQNAMRGQALQEQVALGGYNNDLRQRQLAERLQLRSQPINEISALFGLGGQVATPGGGGGGGGGGVQVQAPDLQGAVQGAYNTRSGQVASNNAASAQTAAGAMAAVGSIAIAI